MSDLDALILRLRPSHSDQIPAWTGRAAQAWFLDALRRVQPELSSAVHDGDGLRPFTISSLEGASPQPDSTIFLHPRQTYSLRLTTLHPDVTKIVHNHLITDWLTNGIILHSQPFRVDRIDPGTPGGASNYSGLVSRFSILDRLSHRLTFDFRSPTAFKKTGGIVVPLPQADLVFGSLVSRWNQFSQLPITDEIREILTTEIAVISARIETHHVSFERAARGAVTGFTGRVTFNLVSDDQDALKWFHVLGAFAPYSGAGLRTTMGLGQIAVRG